ncbi:hypothetical protein GUITHDRAFT_162992 [Guillardia theta CCMP2712]|uniref:Seipin n=1 Tax=Guillardia theta (strain CCMP2712) TaxID=905079 RepID=L1JDH4_GUITC|nr:hypothetical protein GUITHDRAFT_162992 [Guillardia theta CCMP2712]EKX46571.1 hypothetical protein GUITHDRAFT_162992 [Guillardia theta CCMP2712]|eukprot:XP_005833551.1 hypothetical protein GUITHDRAFT_162992 [Guillardia theta CCMP2712]
MSTEYAREDPKGYRETGRGRDMSQRIEVGRLKEFSNGAPNELDGEGIPEWVFAMVWWPVSFMGYMLRLIGRFSKLAFLFSVSAATYYWLYGAIVPPSLSESHPINFLYPLDSKQRKGGVPTNATVDFAFYRQLMVRSGTRGMDWSSSMSPGSSLDIGITLVLPESPANVGVGPFMVKVVVFDKQGNVVGEGSRSMILRHKSSLLQTMSTVFYSIPLVLGFTSEHQAIRGTVVQLISFPKGGLQRATVSISDSRLQVYSASIDISFVLTGFRYYLYHWFVTSMVIGTIVISNLYVSLISWMSRKLFGASWSVEEDFSMSRYPPQYQGDPSANARRRRQRRSNMSKPRSRSEDLKGEALPGGADSPDGPFNSRSDESSDEKEESERFANVSDETDDNDLNNLRQWERAAINNLPKAEDEMEEVNDIQVGAMENFQTLESSTSENTVAPSALRNAALQGVRRRNQSVPGPASARD